MFKENKKFLSKIMLFVYTFTIAMNVLTFDAFAKSNYAEVTHKYILEDGSPAPGIPSSAPTVKKYAWDSNLGDSYWQQIDLYLDNPQLDFVGIRGACKVREGRDSTHPEINVNTSMTASKSIVYHVYKKNGFIPKNSIYIRYLYECEDGSKPVGINSDVTKWYEVSGDGEWVDVPDISVASRYSIKNLVSDEVKISGLKVWGKKEYTKNNPGVVKIILKDSGSAVDEDMAHITKEYKKKDGIPMDPNLPIQTQSVPLNGKDEVEISVSSRTFLNYKCVKAKVNGEETLINDKTGEVFVIVKKSNTRDNPLKIEFIYEKIDSYESKITIRRVLRDQEQGIKHESEVSSTTVKKGSSVQAMPSDLSNNGYTHKSTEVTDWEDGVYTGKNTPLNLGNKYTFMAQAGEHKVTHYYDLQALKKGLININVVDNLIKDGQPVMSINGGYDYFGRKNHNNLMSDDSGRLKYSCVSPTRGIFKENGKERPLKLIRVVLTNGQGEVIPAWNGNTVIQSLTPSGSEYKVDIQVNTAIESWYVHYFWNYDDTGEEVTDPDPPVGEGDGVIKFDPNETDWTNKGKISEGVGKYPVKVYYEGQYPRGQEATCKWKEHYTERKCSGHGDDRTCTTVDKWRSKTSKYITYWLLDKIRVTAHNTNISPTYVNGNSGYIDITKENEGISLDAVGEWESTKKSSTHKEITGQDIHVSDNEPQPPKPTGKSGKYNIDWTKPDINIDDPNSKWVNSPKPYVVNVGVDENLSGFNIGDINVTDSSHYQRNSSDSVDYAAKVYNKKVHLYDGIYAIKVDVTDRAGNSNTITKKTYYVDHEKPVFDFNIKPGIFSEENGAVRKPSKKGIDDGFYGKLTASDNLSGVNKIEFGWTFGNVKNEVEYETLYSSPYTYTDRYKEKIEKEIEKPVGDNLYLHVKIVDTAGNKDYKVFGPYEDPIKLRDFEISDVRDPKWKNVFYDKNNNPTGVKFGASKLPLDNTSNPVYKNADIKKGYAFYFNLTSEYLYREEDRITIKPTFYYVNGKERFEVDMYYELNNNPFIKCGSKEDTVRLKLKKGIFSKVDIGKLSQLTLTKDVRVCKGKEWLGLFGWKHKYPADVQYKDGKEQYWYGKYYVPPISIFVKKGEEPRPENLLEDGEILINFEILGYKNGEETLSTDQIFVYVPKQWQKEGGPKSSKFEPGDIIKYNNKKNVLRDFKTQITY